VVDNSSGAVVNPKPVGSTNVTVNNLGPGIVYRVRVRACSSGGCGPWSEDFVAQTLKKGKKLARGRFLGNDLCENLDICLADVVYSLYARVRRRVDLVQSRCIRLLSGTCRDCVAYIPVNFHLGYRQAVDNFVVRVDDYARQERPQPLNTSSGLESMFM
jgi:Fibronectin type III domain